MTPMAVLQLLVLAAEEEHEVSQAVAWGVGGLAFAILLGLLFALLAFGKGREHS